MKPTRNRVMCPDCKKPKMLFETERKANDFIKWNGEEIEHGESLRAYYCPSCCGWHISHHCHKESYDTQTDSLIEAYARSRKPHGKLDRLIRSRVVMENEQAEKTMALQVYADIPEEIKQKCQKSLIREYMKKYFSDNNFDDHGGRIRGQVYKLFSNDMIQRFRGLK